MARPKTRAATSTAAPRYDIDYVKSLASSQWLPILAQVGGFDSDTLDGDHHPCPKCGGGDRFRLLDADAGAIICNQCARTGIGDGFASLTWMTGRKFADVLAEVAEYLGIPPTSAAANGNGKSNGKSNGKLNGKNRSAADPAEHLKFLPWTEGVGILAATWCLSKPPITVAAIRAVGGMVARYRDKYTVIALPVWDSDWAGTSAKPCGWSLYNVTGGTLPKWGKPKADGSFDPPEQVKVKLAHGSKPGIICDRSKIATATKIWKLEGPSDLLAWLSLANIPADCTAMTNANGAGEIPQPWMLDIFAGKLAMVCHDADEPGQRGAVGHVDSIGQNGGQNGSGKSRPGWANLLAKVASESRNVMLPFAVEISHGKDLRDYILERHGC